MHKKQKNHSIATPVSNEEKKLKRSRPGKIFDKAIPIFSLLLLLPLFFYRLDAVSLSSWDEAWYGVIAKNIYKSKDIFNLVFNNSPFYDHPPLGFWLQTLSFNIFGISNFSVRFSSAVLGFSTLLAVYLLGKELFGKWAGLFSAIALSTSPWFLLRARSGNLDVLLTFFLVLSFYLCIKASKNAKYLTSLSISLALLFLTKSLVPFTIVPVLIVVLWKKIKPTNLVVPVLIFFAVASPWFYINWIKNPGLLQRYFSVGYPGGSPTISIWQNILLTKTYLHNGMGNWFRYGLLSLVVGFVLYRKKYFTILTFVGVFLLPFAFSHKGQVWHLIPLHPFWILSFFGILELSLQNTKYKIVIMIAFLYIIAFGQFKRNWHEIINVPRYVSDIEILSKEAKKFGEDLYLDDDSVPEALFYSGKNHIVKTYGGDLKKLFEGNTRFLLITRNWRIKEEEISGRYEIIKTDRDKLLIRRI